MSSNENIKTLLLQHTLRAHAHPVYCLEKGPGPSSFFSAGGDKIVALWDLKNIDTVTPIAHTPATVYALCYIADKNWLAVGQAEGGIHLIDLETNKVLKYWTYHQKGVFSLAHHAASNTLWASSADGRISGWDLTQLSFIKAFITPAEKVRQLAIHPELPIMAAACSDTTIRIFNIPELTEKNAWSAHNWAVNCVKWALDGTLWSASKDAYLRVWDAPSEQLLNSWAVHNYAVYQIGFSPNNAFLATASRDKSLKVWQFPTLRPVQKLARPMVDGHKYSVNTLLWHPLQNCLISGSDDRTLKIWSYS